MRVGRFALLVALVVLWCVSSVGVGVAGASGGVTWSISSVASPTNLVAGDGSGDESFVVTVVNTGGAATDGSAVSVGDVLPPGVSAHAIAGFYFPSKAPLSCSTATVSCSFEGVVQPGDELWLDIKVDVGALAQGSVATNRVAVSGGGVPGASFLQGAPVSSTPASFGLAEGSVFSALSTTQAGAHPDFTTSLIFNTEALDTTSDSVKDVHIALPPGLVGNPTVLPQCTMADVEVNECPTGTALGVAVVLVAGGGEVNPFSTLLYNIRPYPDEPAAFGFNVAGIPVRLDVSVHPNSAVPGGYELHVAVGNVTEASQVMGTTVTLWGVPADHNGPGEPGHFVFGGEPGQSFGGRGGGPRLPFFTNATQCGQATSLGLAVDSWGSPGQQTSEGLPVLSDGAWSQASVSLGTPTGCESLRFEPTLSLTPDRPLPGAPVGYQAGAPAGYDVALHVPQNENPDALATPDLKDATIALPVGVVVSPSAADGLQACSLSEIAFRSALPPGCPEGAKVGTVEVLTPLLASPLHGSVYLAEQNENPFGSLLAMYIVAEGAGVVIKLPGEIHADGATGQLTTTFANNPQVPFSDLRLHLNGGSRAPLANPRVCGPATTTSLLTPYAGASATPSSTFEVRGCSSQFAPSFTAGTTSNQAGSFSPLSVTFSRTDADQEFGRAQFTMAPGLLGIIKGVEQCTEALAAADACPAGSLIGHTTVGAGPGNTPFFLGGSVYLTGPYHGAPFGLLITVPAIAGPFNLGNVPVRAAIDIDPHTLQLKITSDPLPTILQGIPLQIKTVNVTVDRPNFTFNATSCEPLQIAGTLASTQGTTATVASRYQAAGCQSLAFAPKFSASTSAKTTRAGGASLHVHVGYPSGAQANIHSVAVTLPKQLPARLSTIQQACPDATYSQNPAACPAGSLIGVAVATTPVLAGRITGPAYLVSHGGASFPDIDVILQAEGGIRADLTGSINITKAGVTSSTFATVPDVPIASFDLILPEGPHSGLTATTNLCAHPLTMPTTITAQNGTRIKQTTKVQVNGCHAKPKPKKKKKKR
jgi:hypothetical protein